MNHETQPARNDQAIVRIAMWSGPRNISTATMRSWENRPDTVVVDEPLYGHYLKKTGLEHPGREDVMAAQESDDWRCVVDALTGDVPDSATIFYQKHMAHHLLPDMGTEWLDALINCFLIRQPSEMLTSLIKVTRRPEVDDTGLPQQLRMLRELEARTGERPIVLDAREMLTNPRRMLSAFCSRIDVPFEDAMLSWPAGRRASDGVWAPYWYTSVEQSTGFAPWRDKNDEVPDELRGVLAECNDIYEELHSYRLTAGDVAP